MVTWLDGSGMATYDPTIGSPNIANASFVPSTAGCVDLGGSTRHQYTRTGFAVTGFRGHAILNVTFNDVGFATGLGRRVTATMYVVAASYFTGVPNPDQVVFYARSGFGLCLRSMNWGPETLAPGESEDTEFPFVVPPSFTLAPNTKYWVVIMPSVAKASADPKDDFILQSNPASTINNLAKGLSLWTNRTPGAPRITAPLNGTARAEGETFTFSMTGGDPDATFSATTPENKDWAGVQVQYASLPSKSDPSPTWQDLPFNISGGPSLGPGWSFAGNTKTGPETLRQTGTVEIKGGTYDMEAGKGVLPSGTWLLRARTFDYGHAYPLSNDPGPQRAVGVGAAPGNYPAVNTSPWSNPVTLTVTARVPSPLPMSPTDGTAVVLGKPITLTWRYRNTATPPSAQAGRAVQIRKVGDPDWITLSVGATSSQTLPVSGTVSAGAELVTDPGFETGSGDDGWELASGLWTGLETVSGIFPDVHSGTKALKVTPALNTDQLFYQSLTLDPAHTAVRLDGWFRNAHADGSVTAHVVWGNGPSSTSVWNAVGTVVGTDWQNIKGDIPRPPGVTTVRIVASVNGANVDGFTVDDISLKGLTPAADPFVFDPNTQYEWRVQATDSTDVTSDFSPPSRFWVVPPPLTGATNVLPADTIDGATLGCGTHRVFVYRRGGLVDIGELKFKTGVDYNRVRDDISTAKITIAGWDIDCGNLLSTLKPWAHEIVIFRSNGFSMERVWEGPITLLTYEGHQVTIHAKDVMAYAYRRIIRQLMSDMKDGDTVVSRASRVLQNAFAPSDPNVLANLCVLSKEDDARQYRYTQPYSRTAFEEVDDMASNAGLDYTVVGRSILLWGTKHRIGTLPEFRDMHLGNSPIVSVYGMSTANRYAVSDGNGIWGAAEAEGAFNEDGEDEEYGLIEMLSSTWASDAEGDTGTYTQEGLAKVVASFEEFAARAVSDRYPPPVVVRVPDNTTLNPNTPISIQHLVPGVVVPLRSTNTLRTVVATQKLDSIKVTESGGAEVITITMSPFNRDDAELSEGETE